FFYENGLIAHSFSVEYRDRFLDLCVVLQFDVAESRRHACNKISHNADGPRPDSPRFHPFLQLPIGTVVRNIDEEQLGHRIASNSRTPLSARHLAELSGFCLPRTLLPDFPMLEGIKMTASRTGPRPTLWIGIALMDHLNNQMAVQTHRRLTVNE